MTCLSLAAITFVWAKYSVKGEMPIGALFLVSVMADVAIAGIIFT